MDELIDLTRVVGPHTPVYRRGDYTDPPIEVSSWCTVAEQGFAVQRLSLGTQSGTHIDAPAHFVDGGATLDDLGIDELIGPYTWVDLDQGGVVASSPGPMVFLGSTTERPGPLPRHRFAELLSLPAQVWVAGRPLAVEGMDELGSHRLLAEHGRFLVEDLDPGPASRVRPGGTLHALPLRLPGSCGAPCRVVVRQRARLSVQSSAVSVGETRHQRLADE